MEEDRRKESFESEADGQRFQRSAARGDTDVRRHFDEVGTKSSGGDRSIEEMAFVVYRRHVGVSSRHFIRGDR